NQNQRRSRNPLYPTLLPIHPTPATIRNRRRPRQSPRPHPHPTPTGQSMKTAPLKYFASVTLGKMLQSDRPKPGQKLLPYLKASSITEQGLDTSNLQEMPFSCAEQKALDLRRDDVVVVEGGSIGRCAYISEDLPGVHFQNAINRVRPRLNVDGRYLRYSIEDLRISGYFEAVTNIATIRHLTAEKLAQSPISVHTYARQ